MRKFFLLNSKNFILIISLFLFFILIYIFYKSEIINSGYKRDFYKIYFFIDLFLIIFNFSLLFFNKNIQKIYLTILSSLITALFIIEIYFTYKGIYNFNQINSSIVNQIKEKKFENFDTRSKYQVYYDYINLGKDVILNISPHYFISEKSFFPFSGHSNIEVINGNENGYYASYWSDRYGFNNFDKVWESEKIDFILIGDSFINGHSLNKSENISSAIEKNSNKKVLNLGQNGIGPLIEYGILREFYKEASTVLWFYYEGNDLDELNIELKNELLKKYLDDDNFTQKLITKQNITNQKVKLKFQEELNYINSFKEKNFKGIIKLVRFRQYLHDYFSIIKLNKENVKKKENQKILSNDHENVKKLEKVLFKVKSFVESKNSNIFFIYLPSYSTIDTDKYNQEYSLIVDMVKNLELPFIDIKKLVFDKSKDPLTFFPFSMHGHYTKEASKNIAVETLKFIEKFN